MDQCGSVILVKVVMLCVPCAEATQAGKQVGAKAAAPAKQAQQAASDAASSAEKPSRDLLSNVFSGLKLPWQQGNGAKQQQVSQP